MRLIDGDKLIAELNREKEFNRKQENIRREWDLIAYIAQIESGRFDIAEDIGIQKVRELLRDITGDVTVDVKDIPTERQYGTGEGEVYVLPGYKIITITIPGITDGGKSDE